MDIGIKHGAGGTAEITNGTIAEYMTTGDDIAANNFVTITGGKIQLWTSGEIGGLTKTAATATIAGEVWVLGG